jgi:hypothetical protein
MPEKQTSRHDRRPPAQLDPSSFWAPRRAARASRSGALHICPACNSDLVYPLDWAPAETGWSVDLRCPDCEWLGSGIHSQSVVDRFDEALDLGTEQLLEDLTLLTRANMEEQVERFAAALRTDQILPEDF